jgi:hypothetical protein
MADEDIVTSVNTELKEMRDDAANHRENPRLIQLMESLIKLTNSEEDNAALAKTATPAKPPQPTDAEILAAFKAGKLKAV